MIKVFLLLSFLFSSILYAQQHPKICYFNKSGRQPIDFEDTSYVRVKTDTPDYFQTYRYKTGILMFEGKIIHANDTSDNKNEYRGWCSWYYPNGNKKLRCYYNDNGLNDSLYSEYYENGSPIKQISYENGKFKNKRYTEYTPSGESVLVFEDTFLDNLSHWNLQSSDSLLCRMRIGGLYLSNKLKKNYGSCIPFHVDSLVYSIETNLNSNYIQGNAEAGLVFGFHDWNNYYYFTASKSVATVGQVKNGQSSIICQHVSYALKPSDWNKLQIFHDSSTFSFLVNQKLQFSLTLKGVTEESAGFVVSPAGQLLCDNLIIRQYPSIYKDKNINNQQDNAVMYDGKLWGTLSVSCGLLLSRDGYIMTTIKNIKHFNKIIIKAYDKDSIKTYFADIAMVHSSQEMTLLKINNLSKDTLSSPVYSYLKADNLKLGTPVQSHFISRIAHTDNYRHTVLSGALKSFACYENFSTHFDSSINTDSRNNGGPIFTEKGELIGLIDEVSVEKESYTKAIKIRYMQEMLFNLLPKIEISKTPVDQSLFEKNIHKCIVQVTVI